MYDPADRITISFNSGSQLWEVMLDNKIVFVTTDSYEAHMFSSELKIKIKK